MEKKPLRELVAARINHVLAEKRLKPEDLPKLTDLSLFQVRRYLSGKNNIPLDFLDELERLLRTPIVSVENMNGDFSRRVITNTMRKIGKK